jgi:hypothetical protein
MTMNTVHAAMEELERELANARGIAQACERRAEKAEAALRECHALLQEAYAAMREPTGEWHDYKCNVALVRIRVAIDATLGGMTG